MADHWASYFCNVDDKQASIFLNLGLRSSVPDSTKPWLLWIWVYFKLPRPDGLSSSEEFETLVSIEKALEAQLKSKCGAILSGRITTDGHREFYFYAPSPGAFEEVVNGAMADFPTYEFDCGQKQDAHWNQFLDVLY